MNTKEKRTQRQLERSEGILEAIDERLPIAKKESEVAKAKAISKPNDMGATLDFMIKTRIVESLLDVKIVILKEIGRVIEEAKKEEEVNYAS